MIYDIPTERTAYDPDKRIEKTKTLEELESWSNGSNEENNKFSSLEELLLETYYYEKDNEESERIFNVIKLVYKIRKDILSICQKYNRSIDNEVIQIIDELLNL